VKDFHLKDTSVNSDTKQISEWQDKVHSSFQDEHRLFEYLFETLDNFFYRYLETSTDKNLKTKELGNKKFGVFSFESDMVQALKVKGASKGGIMELAKTVPREKGPKVRYGLWAQIDELHTDRGELTLVAEVNWGFPEFEDKSKSLQQQVKLKYTELQELRKNLALKLEEVCEVFS